MDSLLQAVSYVAISSISSISPCPCVTFPKVGVRNSPAVPRRGRFPPRPLPRAAINRMSSLSKPASSEGFVDVIGIGSRKDAVIDFCLDSPFASSSRVRFGTIDSRDSVKVQILQRNLGDATARDLVFPLSLYPCPLATILVASAGYGSDDITAVELLSSVKSEGGLTVGVLLKPFWFEGQRRQQEVDDLIVKLQKCSHFCIVVETDTLLKTEEETLAEAIRMVNNAVLVSITMISVLIDDKNFKFLDTPNDELKELQYAEIIKDLESNGESKVGYGAGYDIKSSLTQAVFNCPFLTSKMKSSNGIVIFSLASARTMDKNEISAAVQIFRQMTHCNKRMVFCGVHEPSLEQNLVITTLLVLGCNENMVYEKNAFLSGLVNQFPLFFSLLKRDQFKPTVHPPNDKSRTSVEDFAVPDLKRTSESDFEDDMLHNLNTCQGQKCSKTPTLGHSPCSSLFEDGNNSVLDAHCQLSKDEMALPRDQLDSLILDEAFENTQLCVEERTLFSGSSKKLDGLDVFSLPVGVKSNEKFVDCSHSSESAGFKALDASDGVPNNSNFPSRAAFTDANLEAEVVMSSPAVAHFKDKTIGSSSKQGLLSVRAASMLEAERESEKKWAPIMELEYRGGLYRGRCQGGLPEGKGRLTLSDGSFYDGMWRYGKRSGLGMFCFSNGDVFQGTWRDDFMHGKI